MTSIFLDADLKAKLRNLDEQVNLLDASGNPVGCFLPHSTYQRLMRDLIRLEVNDEQLAAAREDYRKNGGVDFSEALSSLPTLNRNGKPKE